MSDANKLVDAIRTKTGIIISKLRSMDNENRQLRQKLEESLRIIEDQNKIIEELKIKNTNLKIVKTIKQEEGNRDVKITIDELVREIDKCIRLLNK